MEKKDFTKGSTSASRPSTSEALQKAQLRFAHTHKTQQHRNDDSNI